MGIAANKMTIALLFVCPAQPAIWGLMNDSKCKHENKISNAQSNPLYQPHPFIGLAVDSVQISATGIRSKIYAN